MSVFLSHDSQDLRFTFQSDEHPCKKLKAKDRSEPIDEGLLKAMLAYKKSSSNRGPLNSFIVHAKTVNQRELIGILQYFLQLCPTASAEQFRYCISVLDLLVRLDVRKNFGDEFNIVKGHVDQVLLVAWTKQQGKQQGKARRLFLELYEQQWPLLLPEEAVKTIMGHEGAWVDVEAELVAVAGSSCLGRELFGVCCSQVLAEKVASVIRKHVVRLFGQNKLISQDVYDTAKRAALAELQACHLEGLPDRRKVELWYRGCAFHTTITCLGDEVEHKFNVELKAHAAASNLIPKLFCEDAPGKLLYGGSPHNTWR